VTNDKWGQAVTLGHDTLMGKVLLGFWRGLTMNCETQLP
jgi:hypothetical protein